jgi:hypothetical protein
MTTLRKFGVLLVVLAVGSVAFTGGALADADASADSNYNSGVVVVADDSDGQDSSQLAAQGALQDQGNYQSSTADSDNTADDRRGMQVSDVFQDSNNDQDADSDQEQSTSSINAIMGGLGF